MRLMHSVHMTVVTLAAAALGGAVFLMPASPGGAEHHEGSLANFDSEGNLLRPEGYREWVFVGTPLTPNDMNGGMAVLGGYFTL